MKLVQFKDGRYGVRVSWFFGWCFIDLQNTYQTWEKGSKFFCYCKGTRKEAEAALDAWSAKHKVIK